MRTDKEITAEIKKLKAMKPKTIQRSFFGADHHAAIDAQVEVLTKRMETDDIYDKFPNRDETGAEEDCPSNVFEAALEAGEWMHEQNETPAPSVGWKELER